MHRIWRNSTEFSNVGVSEYETLFRDKKNLSLLIKTQVYFNNWCQHLTDKVPCGSTGDISTIVDGNQNNILKWRKVTCLSKLIACNGVVLCAYFTRSVRVTAQRTSLVNKLLKAVDWSMLPYWYDALRNTAHVGCAWYILIYRASTSLVFKTGTILLSYSH